MFGGQLSWKQLGGDTILVEEHVWLSCGYDLTDYAKTVSFMDLSTGTSKNFALTEISTRNFTPLCNSYTSCANGIYPYLITDHYLSAKVVISYCNFKVYVQFPAASTNLTTTYHYPIYLECKGNKCLKGKNAGPAFMDDPSVVAYNNVCTTIYNNAKVSGEDSSGRKDSVSYKLISPLMGSNQPYSYNAGYAYDQPVKFYGTTWSDPFYPSCKGFHADTATGQINFRAENEDKTFIAMQASEWRKDSSGIVMVGNTMRCWELDVVQGHDLALYPNGYKNNVIYCYSGVNDTLSFPAISYDTAVKSISIQLLDSIPHGAAFSTQKAKFSGIYVRYGAVGLFTWKPTEQDIKHSPYRICLHAQDTVCPLPSMQQVTALLYVVPKPDTIGLSINNATQCLNGNLFSCTPHVNDIAHLCRYIYDYGDGTPVTGSTTHRYNSTGRYRIRLIVLLEGDTLGYKDTTAWVNNKLIPGFTYATKPPICGSTTVHFFDKTKVDTGAISYLWKFGDGDTSTQKDPVHTFKRLYPYNGSQVGWLTLVVKSGDCIDSVYEVVYVPIYYSSQAITAASPNFCNKYQFSANLGTNKIDTSFNVSWDFGDGGYKIINDLQPAYTFSKSGTDTVTLTVTSRECTFTKKYIVNITLRQLDFASDARVCQGSKVDFVNETNINARDSLKWDFGDGKDTILSPGNADASHIYTTEGIYSVTLSVPGDNCYVPVKKPVSVIEVPDTIYITGDTDVYVGDTIAYRLEPPRLNCVWTISGGSIVSGSTSPVVYVVWNGQEQGELNCDASNFCVHDQRWISLYPKVKISGLKSVSADARGLKVYPNPSHSDVMVEFTARGSEQYTIEMDDITGKRVFYQFLGNCNGLQQKNISLQELPAGCYYLRLSSDGGQSIKKLIKL